MEMSMFFAKKLKEARKSMGLTQKQLADKINYSGKSVSKWESGDGLPTVETLVQLSKILNVSVDHLIVEPVKVRYYLGIDGGGTKTKFRICDEQGNILEEVVKPASNPSNIGFDKALEVLKSGIDEICANFPYNQTSVFAGLAGFTKQNKQGFVDFLSKYPFVKIGVGQDIEIITSAGLDTADGIVAIMGTGSVVRCQSNLENFTIGGWGTHFDNGGSGYRLGRDAVIAALREIDGSGEHTVLTKMIEEKLGTPANQAISELYKKGATYIASLSDITIRAAKYMDPIAMKIVDENCKEMASLIDTAAKRISAPEIPVVFSGGLTNEADFLFGKIRQYQKDRRDFNYKVLDKDPVHGAVLLAGCTINKGE